MKPIILSHLYKSYDGAPVLVDFNAVLAPGTVTALMAPSGAGKTTLLRILMGLDKPDSGTVSGLEGLRIGTVFQEDRLCPALGPVENIRLANPAVSPERAAEALRGVGLGDALSKRAEEMSGGMSRRVAILRALMADCDLLLLDEPFRGLDAETKELVMQDARRRFEGRTVLLVTHDSSELAPLGAGTCLTLPNE